MTIDVDSVQAFTDAELLKLCRAAVAAITLGQSYSIGGRSLTRADLDSLWETIERLEGRIEAASDTHGDGIVQARLGDAS
ncbi:MAG: hypothetical protein ACPGVG_15045 [Mycobacterium sp.]